LVVELGSEEWVLADVILESVGQSRLISEAEVSEEDIEDLRGGELGVLTEEEECIRRLAGVLPEFLKFVEHIH
jgi:hypothetical protein